MFFVRSLILSPVAGMLLLATGRGSLELPASILDSNGNVILQDGTGVRFHVNEGPVSLVGFSNRVSIYCAADGAQRWTPIGRNVACPASPHGTWVAIVSDGKSSKDASAEAFVCAGDCTDHREAMYRRVLFVESGE